MKEGNEFPNIKPSKLKEEIKNNNSNIKISKYRGFNYCLIYFISFSLIISLIVLNYIKTKDAFKENKYIILPADKLCNKKIEILEECIKDKKELSKCINENREVENCYNDSYTFNKICFVYISDLELCLRKNNHDNNKCDKYLNEIIKCTSAFRYLKVEKDDVKKLVNYYIQN